MNSLRKRRDPDQPDVEGAREQLKAAKGRRADVDRLVAAIAKQGQLNSFTASAVIVFRGGKS